MARHRGVNATAKSIMDLFYCIGLRQDVVEFVEHCLHSMVVVGERVPRPLGAALRATKPNEVLHFDFLTMSQVSNGSKYILVLKDGMSGFCELIPWKQDDAETVVH
uniref:AlNc14C357G10959 protein n=1 Tax=Albugo laibachii Nc14 TaxID=890382 RepID=F0WXK8_9STRA|nr:AlNc14C357G10959 [Albugo laibachii Nc14]|eukprot:CCA26202.1 AlNc14C357G10959 [Albugo laibachii Nc14]